MHITAAIKFQKKLAKKLRKIKIKNQKAKEIMIVKNTIVKDQN